MAIYEIKLPKWQDFKFDIVFLYVQLTLQNSVLGRNFYEL